MTRPGCVASDPAACVCGPSSAVNRWNVFRRLRRGSYDRDTLSEAYQRAKEEWKPTLWCSATKLSRTPAALPPHPKKRRGGKQN